MTVVLRNRLEEQSGKNSRTWPCCVKEGSVIQCCLRRILRLCGKGLRRHIDPVKTEGPACCRRYL